MKYVMPLVSMLVFCSLATTAARAEDSDGAPVEDTRITQARDAQRAAWAKFRDVADRKELLERKLIASKNFHEVAENSRDKAKQDVQDAKNEEDALKKKHDHDQERNPWGYDGRYDNRGIAWRNGWRDEDKGQATANTWDNKAKSEKDQVTNQAIVDKTGKNSTDLQAELDAIKSEYEAAESAKKQADATLAALLPKEKKDASDAPYRIELKNGKSIDALSLMDSDNEYIIKTPQKKFVNIPKGDVERVVDKRKSQ